MRNAATETRKAEDWASKAAAEAKDIARLTARITAQETKKS